MKSGFIYVLSNSSYTNNLYKIGKTTRGVSTRVKELSSDTGVPQNFNIEFCEWVKDVHTAELQVHEELSEHRVNHKEFFNVPLTIARTIIRKVSDNLNKESETKISIDSDICNRIYSILSNIADEKLYSDLSALKDETESAMLKVLCSNYLGEYYKECGLHEAALKEFDFVKKSIDKLELYGIDSNKYWESKADSYVALNRFKNSAYCLQFIKDPFISRLKRAELFVKLGSFDQAMSFYNELLNFNDRYFSNLIKDRVATLEIIIRNKVGF